MHRFRQPLLGTVLVSLLAKSAAAFTIGPPAPVGTITASVLGEVSGLADGRANPGVFWVHNDSGDLPRFFAIDHQGALLGTFPLVDAMARDWEDIAIGPRPGGGAYLYLGDIGDNNRVRTSITVYRTPEPLSTASATIGAADYATAVLQYPVAPKNAESLLLDPITGDLYIITKNSSVGSIPEIYSAPASAFDQPTTTLIAHGDVNTPLRTSTAADISPDGRFIVLRNTGATGYLFQRQVGESIADALHRPGQPFALGLDPQGEAIAWAADGKSFFTASEFDDGPSSPIYSYAFAGPQPGDFDADGDVDHGDLAVWQAHYGVDAWADANLDLTSDGEDFLAWQRNLDAPAEEPLAAVPEPATATLVATTALLLWGARRSGRTR